MNLESELKQKQFNTAEERVMVNILYTAYRINDHLACILSPYKISVQQYNILRILRGQYPSCASVILLKERMIDKNSGVSRLVEKLRLKGFIERKVNENDRRQVDVKILPAGLKALKEIDQKILLFHRSARISRHKNLNSINTFLDTLRTNLKSSF